MLIISLAILTYLLNNSIQFDKTYFIRNILNNTVLMLFALIIMMRILHLVLVFIFRVVFCHWS